MEAIVSAVGASVPIVAQRLRMRTPFNEEIPLKEDTLRYIVFNELVKSSIDITRLTLEYPHPEEGSQEEIDTVILDSEGAPIIAIEFKYHRSNPSGNNLPRPMLAGQLLADCAKLRRFLGDDITRVVVYLTDGEMLQYLGNRRNNLWMLLDPWREQRISDTNLPSTRTLRREAGDWTRPVWLRMMAHWYVGSDHNLIVWRVGLAQNQI